MEEKQSTTESRLAALESGVQVEVNDGCRRIAKLHLQNKQILDLRQEILCEIAKIPAAESTQQKSVLGPAAPLFTPLSDETTALTSASGDVRGAGQGACAAKAAQRATPYDGRSA